MSKIRIALPIVVLIAALSATAHAGPPAGVRGGGGAPHAGGGGVPHIGGGGVQLGGAGVPHIGRGGIRFGGSGAPQIGRGGGQFGGGAPHISASPAIRSFAIHNAPGGINRSATFNVRTGPSVKANSVRRTLNSHQVAGALHNSARLYRPNSRAHITASAATAGWHGGRDHRSGWWRHRNGGYGWVGPLFWPFAYYDIYDYALWGHYYDDTFWGYGYEDIYAGLFAPYSYDNLLGYFPYYASAPAEGGQPSSSSRKLPPAPVEQVAQMCGEDVHDIAGLPTSDFLKDFQPTETQRAAFDELASASAKAAQGIKAACPTEIILTAPGRLANMQQRIEAMLAAIAVVQPPLEKFYGLLSDEQKARLTAIGNERRENKPAPARSLACGSEQPGVTQWPSAEIERAVHPTEAQRAALAELQNASIKATNMLKEACPAENPLTPPARLAAVDQRLRVMLQAVNIARTALDRFYATLNDEQKVKFEAIGPLRRASSNRSTPRPPKKGVHQHVRHSRAHKPVSVGQLIRRLTLFAS